MYCVKELYTGEVVAKVADKEELMQFIGKQALELNYGMYRHWKVDGIAYFDCGPRTYYVDADILQNN